MKTIKLSERGVNQLYFCNARKAFVEAKKRSLKNAHMAWFAVEVLTQHHLYTFKNGRKVSTKKLSSDEHCYY